MQQVDLLCQTLDEASWGVEFPYKSHHMMGSSRENQEKIVAALKHFVDTNSLVTNCCWRASEDDWQGESFLEEFKALKEENVKDERELHKLAL